MMGRIDMKLPCAVLICRCRSVLRKSTWVSTVAMITTLFALVLPSRMALAQVTNFAATGAVQTYTVPSGAGGVQIRAVGAGGGGAGTDLNGSGGSGGAGAVASGIYFVAPGTVLNVYPGVGGVGGVTSAGGAENCTTSAGAGGAGGFAGGSGGRAGCNGYSGGGGGGGGSSVVFTAANAPLVIAGGGGGGQGGALQINGKNGLDSIATGATPGSAGTNGGTTTDGGGGGGGGGGCPGGAGGEPLVDLSPTNTTIQAAAGSSCSNTASVTSFSVAGGGGGAGGAGRVNTGANYGVELRAASGTSGSITITPLFPTLGLVKSQPAAAFAVGANSTYTLTVTNSSTTPAFTAQAVDQLPSSVAYVGSSGAGWTCSPSANASGTLVTCNFSGTISASGGFSAFQIAVTPTTNATVTNYAAIDAAGGSSPPAPQSCTAANAPSVGCAAPVVSPVTRTLTGFVYSDTNHNSNLDVGETGTGLTSLYVKLATSSGGTCSGPATVAALSNSTSGAYTLPAVAQGSYCLILSNNATLSDITPGRPAGWIGTQNSSGVIQLTVVSGAPAPQNYGLYNGSQLIARVFGDTGATGGIGNDGVQNGAEPGLSNVVVNAFSAGNVVATSTADVSGNVVLWLPAATTGTVVITPAAPSGYLATGGVPGTTGGTYTRPSVSFTEASGTTYSGVSFGLIPPNTLSSDGAETLQPASVFFYPHTFVAGSAGQVSFSTSAVANPVVAGWAETLYRDANCNGQLDAAETQITGPISVVAGQQLCLLLKEFVPANAPLNAQNKITLSATTNYSGTAAPATNVVTRVDVTTVAGAGALRLVKLVQNLTAGTSLGTSNNALPGNALQYQLSLTNQGSSSLTTLLVNDSIPAFTNFVSAACPAPASLPSGLTGCTVSSQPTAGGQGNLQWTLTGSLAPGSQVAVTFQVTVAQ